MLSVESFDTIAEAERSMRERTRYLAGGTLVMRAANYGDPGFDRIVLSRDPALRRIQIQGDTVILGAGSTMADVIASPLGNILSPAARAVGGPAIRNVATVGGNLFAPSPYGDFAAALLALGAVVQFADGSSSDIEAFLAQRGSTRKLVASVAAARRRIPFPQGDQGKAKRRVSHVDCGVAAPENGEGRRSEGRFWRNGPASAQGEASRSSP